MAVFVSEWTCVCVMHYGFLHALFLCLTSCLLFDSLSFSLSIFYFVPPLAFCRPLSTFHRYRMSFNYYYTLNYEFFISYFNYKHFPFIVFFFSFKTFQSVKPIAHFKSAHAYRDNGNPANGQAQGEELVYLFILLRVDHTRGRFFKVTKVSTKPCSLVPSRLQDNYNIFQWFLSIVKNIWCVVKPVF